LLERRQKTRPETAFHPINRPASSRADPVDTTPRIGVASRPAGLNPPGMPSEFSLTRQVEFHETDMAGIMHFANFFRWMEICETAFYRSLGLPLISFVPGQVVGWPRVRASCDYRAPLRFNDTAEVKLFVKKLGTRSVTYLFQFRKGSELVAQGEVTAVCVAADSQGGMVAQPIPADVRAKLQEAPVSAYAG
jgi:YbgC/YbaW family acyl-CoA thioester hydrolase